MKNKAYDLKIRNIILIPVIIMIMVLLTSCTNTNKEETPEPMEEVQVTVPEEVRHISENGEFVISKFGVVPDFSRNEDALRVTMYTDPLCGDCVRLQEEAGDFFIATTLSGEIELKVIPLNFLGEYSEDDYPLRASAWILAIADKHPKRIYSILEEFYNEDFKPTKENPTKSDEEIKDAVRRAGLSTHEVEDLYNNLDEYKEMVEKRSEGIREDEKLLAMSPIDRMFVPYIHIEGTDTVLNGETENVKEDIIQTLDDYISNGFEPCDELANEPCLDN